jgi:hypothetical protein
LLLLLCCDQRLCLLGMWVVAAVHVAQLQVPAAAAAAEMLLFSCDVVHHCNCIRQCTNAGQQAHEWQLQLHNLIEQQAVAFSTSAWRKSAAQSPARWPVWRRAACQLQLLHAGIAAARAVEQSVLPDKYCCWAGCC